MKAVEISVFGRVQGVGYRYFSIRAAEKFGVLGWTKNLPDGTVRIQAVAEEDALTEFLAALRQGPRMSNVSEVRVDELDTIPEFSGFDMRL